MAHISDIKLIRTDTTLDLSQKAEKDKEETGAGKETSNDMVEENGEQKPEEASPSKEGGLKKKMKKKNKNKKEEEKDISKIISEVRDPEEKDSDKEEDDFWMPPEGDRWDFDDGKDRWGSDLEADEDSENEDAIEENVTGEETSETQELSKRTKRMSIEIEASDLESKNKKKVESTSYISQI